MAMMGRNGIVVVFVAFAVGGIAGWLAESACGGAAVLSKPPYRGDVSPACNNGSARSMEYLGTDPIKAFILKGFGIVWG